MFQMIDLKGVKVPEAPEIDIEKEKILSIYRIMARLQSFDDVFYNAQVILLLLRRPLRLCYISRYFSIFLDISHDNVIKINCQ